MKQWLKAILAAVGASLLIAGSVSALSYLPANQGGTGINSATTTDIGKVLSVSSSNPFTYKFITPSSGSGSGTVGTSTINYVTFYNGTNSVTGTPNLQVTGANIFTATGTNLGIQNPNPQFPIDILSNSQEDFNVGSPTHSSLVKIGIDGALNDNGHISIFNTSGTLYDSLGTRQGNYIAGRRQFSNLSTFSINGLNSMFSIGNTGDSPYFGQFMGESFSSGQWGMYNDSTTALLGTIATSTQQSMFGFDINQKVGSLTNTFFGAPVFRNILDDGLGGFSIQGTSTLATTTITSLTVSGALSLPNNSVTNAELANSSLTINAGASLSGGGSVSLGSSVTIGLSTNVTTTNATTTNLAITGSFNFTTGTIQQETVTTSTITTLNVGTCTGCYTLPTSVTFTSLTTTNLAVTGSFTFTTGTIQQATITTSTITFLNATTVTSTNLIINGLTSQCLTTDSNGKITGTGSACSATADASTGWTALGTNVFLTTSTSFVGIGTSTPSTGLEVYNNTLTVDYPINPTTTGFTSDANRLAGADAVYVSGRYAYVAASGLAIVDISNPAAPTTTGFTSDVTRLNGPTSVYVSGKYAYVTTINGNSLAIVDISNPRAPTTTGYTTDATKLNDSESVYVSGKYAYVAAYGNNGLTIVDISNPSAPAIIGFTTNTSMIGAHSVYVSGKYAYVASQTANSLTIVDVSNPAAPTTTGSTSDATKLNVASSVYVSGKYAYVADYSGNGLAIVDISSSTAPTTTGFTSDANRLGGAISVYVSGKYAYVAANTKKGIAIVDISSSTAPTTTGFTSDATKLNGLFAVYVSGKYAYVVSANSNFLSIVDLKGADISTANIGNIFTNDLTVSENIDVNGSVSIGTGLNIGFGGLNVLGNSGFTTTTMTSSTITQLNFTNLFGSNATTTNLNVSGLTNLGATTLTNGTSTNFNVGTLLSFGSANGTSITSTNANFSKLTFTSATGTNLALNLLAVSSVAGNSLVAKFSSSTGADLFKIFANGILSTSSTRPTISSCGSSPSVVGDNFAGTVTVGSVATSCTVTFAPAFTNTPSCVVSFQSSLAGESYSKTTSALTITATGLGGTLVDYHCIGIAE